MFPFLAPLSASINDKFSARKQDIRKFATQLLKETTTFLENHVEVHTSQSRPRLPMFFVKSYNFLQKEAKEIDHEDKYLNFLPNGIMMQLLTEFGPSEEFPKFEKDGTLEDQQQSLQADIIQFYNDIIEYVKYVELCTGTIPPLPYAYHMTLLTFQRRALLEGGGEDTKENMEDVIKIPGNMQAYLSGIVGNIKEDYVDECTKKHYEAIKDQ